MMGFSAGGHLTATAGTHFCGQRWRPGSNRSRQQPAGLPDSRLPCHLVRPGDCSWRVCSKSSRREPGPKADRGSLQRSSGHTGDAADVPLSYQRGYRRRCREQRALLPCAAAREGAGRDAHLRERTPRRGPGAWGPRAQRVRVAHQRAARARPHQIARRRPISWSDHFGGGSRATSAPVLQLEIGASAVGRYRADPARSRRRRLNRCDYSGQGAVVLTPGSPPPVPVCETRQRTRKSLGRAPKGVFCGPSGATSASRFATPWP